MTDKLCSCCGATVSEANRFCPDCGAAIKREEAPQTVSEVQPIPTPPSVPVTVAQPQSVQPQLSPQPVQPEEYTPGADSKYQPISTWGYIGILFLMGIPCVGLVVMAIWAFGDCRKVNKRNLARAALIMSVVGMIVSLIMGVVVKNAVTDAIEEVESSVLGIFFQEPGEESETDELTSILNSLITEEVTGSAEENAQLDMSDLEGLSELLNSTDLGGLGATISSGDLEGLGATISSGDLEGLGETISSGDLGGLEEFLVSEDLEDWVTLISMLEQLSGEGSEGGGLDWSFSFDAGNETEEGAEESTEQQ